MPTAITSSQNPRYKAALKLKSSRGRRQLNKIIIFGEREFSRAVESGLPIESLFLLDSQNHHVAETFIAEFPDRVFSLAPDLFSELSFGDRDDPVIAIADRPATKLDSISLNRSPLVIVLEALEKPGNIGAIVRTADAVGANALILADPVTDLFHPNSIRAAMGCMFGVQTAIDSSENVKQWLLKHNLDVYATIVDNGVNYMDVKFDKPSAIVLGSEANGLSGVWKGQWAQPVFVPLLGASDSLNVSVTAAVVCYEALRQRRDSVRASTQNP